MQQAPIVEAPPPPRAPEAPARVIVSTRELGSPRAVYQALRDKREVLGDQMSRLLNRRERVANELKNVNTAPAEKAALEEHLQELNTRIIDMEKQLHAADAEVARAAGVPGATTRAPRPDDGGPPEGAIVVGAVFTGIALVIVAMAYARRLWKGTSAAVAQLPAGFEARLTRFEQALDTMAVEIERVSEGQRFLTKVLTDQGTRAVGAGPAQPVETQARAAEPVRRA